MWVLTIFPILYTKGIIGTTAQLSFHALCAYAFLLQDTGDPGTNAVLQPSSHAMSDCSVKVCMYIISHRCIAQITLVHQRLCICGSSNLKHH